ncbi:diguanylate cyclase [Arsukibacterium sp.]|uniref:diguanylate cyclase domain-containing protein n=1 Tax=Arsukibacterium sp. TaxID=1977258 RepID=UPI001BD40BCC|nr:diguanylate cyclase [Arsukibacterium sp.]
MQNNATLTIEQSRLEALQQLGLLNTPPEERFDRITRLAKALFNTDIVLLTLLDEKTQFFKSRLGTSLEGTPRDISFCTHAIMEEKLLVIPDALQDPRFADNPLVTKEPFIRFYAGAVIRTYTGMALGTLCLIDSKPRHFSADEQELLLDLAKGAENEFQLHYLKTLQAENRRLAWIAEQTANGVLYTDTTNQIVWCNSGFSKLCGYSLAELVGKTPAELFLGPDTNPVTIRKLHQQVQQRKPAKADILYYSKHGKPYWVHVYAEPLFDEQQQYQGYISMQTDITERVGKLVEMERLAHLDPLTGLPNRRYFETHFAQSLDRLACNPASPDMLALFIIDLDGFKAVNDNHGHAAGDQVLTDLAQRLKNTIRDAELLARLGGDEFALLADVQHADDVSAIAQRIYQVTEQPQSLPSQPGDKAQITVKLDMSIGIALAPLHSMSQAQLFELADQAMYRAKAADLPFLIYTAGDD